MGRRAKNKQSDPAPFAEVQSNAAPRPSAKKLGKRKAEVEDDPVAKRPSKKVKESQNRKTSSKVRGKDATKNGKSNKAKEKSNIPTIEDESGSSEGWEDVDDDMDLEASKQCATSIFIHIYLIFIPGFLSSSLFRDSDEGESFAGFTGDLDEYEISQESVEFVLRCPASYIELVVLQ